MNPFSPNSAHEAVFAKLPRLLAFRPDSDYSVWRKAVAEKFQEILGDMPEPVGPDLKVEYDINRKDYRERFLSFASEDSCRVPCYLLTPHDAKKPLPVIICLQGHNSGMRLSVGRGSGLKDLVLVKKGHRDLALQAVAQGYAALAVEQRCFGLRKDYRPKSVRQNKHSCHHTAMTALLLGRTLLGERIWDVRKAIDILGTFPELDASRIGCVGHSAGGTIAYYAACIDERIKITVPSCAVCTFVDSIGTRDHCMDNYLPGILKYFDMGDIACLVAPRPLICIAGKQDRIFPLHGVQQAFDNISSIYEKANAGKMCRLIEGPGGHHFYPGPAWAAFKELSGW
jgi:dienelactone hydrolase